MREYKVKFYLSSGATDTGQHYSNYRAHYTGHTLKEAVDSFLSSNYAPVEINTYKRICTSFTIVRGREKGKNIKWSDYDKKQNEV